jgi:hypothetical protein
MYSTSSCVLPEGQFRVLQVTPLVPWTVQPMLLRVWKFTDQAEVVVAERAMVERKVEGFIVRVGFVS